jgi:hypothetical protein
LELLWPEGLPLLRMSELALGFGSFAEDIAMCKTPRWTREQQQQPTSPRLSFFVGGSGGCAEERRGREKREVEVQRGRGRSVGATCCKLMVVRGDEEDSERDFTSQSASDVLLCSPCTHSVTPAIKH